VNLSAEFYGNAIHPPGASSWTARFSFTLLFPKLTKQQEKMLMEQKLKQMEDGGGAITQEVAFTTEVALDEWIATTYLSTNNETRGFWNS
jgi:hypothetical protein